jgi:hypothetical protein
MIYHKYKNIFKLVLYGRNEIFRNNVGDSTNKTKAQISNSTTAYLTSTYSQYDNSKIYRFNLSTQQFPLLAQNSKMILTYARIPGLTNSSIHRTIRAVGAININSFDTERGTNGSPILLTIGEGGTVDVSFQTTNIEFNGVFVPPDYLQKGYIDFELSTVATANIDFLEAEINDLVLNLQIFEPELETTKDPVLAAKVDHSQLQNYNTNWNRDLA